MTFASFLKKKNPKEAAKFVVSLEGGRIFDFPCTINRQEGFIEARFDQVSSSHEVLAPALKDSPEEAQQEEDYHLAFGNGESQRVRIITARSRNCAWLEIVRSEQPPRKRGALTMPTEALLLLESPEKTATASVKWPVKQRIHLSGQGVTVFPSQPKTIGETFIATLVLMDKKRNRIECLVKVTDCVEIPAKRYFKTKLQILDISEKDRETIIGFCIEEQRRLIWRKKRSEF